MKNLFSINKTDNEDAIEFDPTPYLAARVSDEVRHMLSGAFSSAEETAAKREPTEEERALQQKGRAYWKICILCFLGGILLFLLGDSLPFYQSFPALHLIDFALLVVSVVFNVKARRISRKETALMKDNANVDFTEYARRLEEAAKAAAEELGVPQSARWVDILPFHYKMKSDYKTKDTIPVPAGKKNRFDNLAVSMYIEADTLCIATAEELFRIPLADIRGYREYDEDFEIEFWLKDEAYDSETYAAYNIRKAGFYARRMNGYFGVDIRGEYEILIPCYDFPQVQEIMNIRKIS